MRKEEVKVILELLTGKVNEFKINKINEILEKSMKNTGSEETKTTTIFRVFDRYDGSVEFFFSVNEAAIAYGVSTSTIHNGRKMTGRFVVDKVEVPYEA